MPSEGEILSCYSWEAGACFRCARAGVDTTHVQRIAPRSGREHEVRACRPCVLTLEAARQRAAELHGEPYAPGLLGDRKP